MKKSDTQAHETETGWLTRLERFRSQQSELRDREPLLIAYQMSPPGLV